jgi:hypothetical protein
VSSVSSIQYSSAKALLEAKKRGWTKQKRWVDRWAERAGVSRPTIVLFIKDPNRIAKPKTIDAILKPLGMCASDIVERVTLPPTKKPETKTVNV